MIALLLLVGLSVIGVALLSITFTPRFFPAGSRARRRVRVTGFILALPGLLIGCCLVLVLSITILNEPPTLDQLQREFPAKRVDLEKIIRMSDEDASFSRIAPTFVDRVPGISNELGPSMNGDAKAGLPKPRWNAYRSLYSRNGIELGLQRNKWGDVFIVVDSFGLLNRGHASGYLFCRSVESVENQRFQPCVLRTQSGRQRVDRKAEQEAYSFRKISGSWYAYDEGPS